MNSKTFKQTASSPRPQFAYPQLTVLASLHIYIKCYAFILYLLDSKLSSYILYNLYIFSVILLKYTVLFQKELFV